MATLVLRYVINSNHNEPEEQVQTVHLYGNCVHPTIHFPPQAFSSLHFSSPGSSVMVHIPALIDWYLFPIAHLPCIVCMHLAADYMHQTGRSGAFLECNNAVPSSLWPITVQRTLCQVRGRFELLSFVHEHWQSRHGLIADHRHSCW